MQLLPLSVVAAENGLEGKDQSDCNTVKVSNLASCQREEDSCPLFDSVNLMDQRFLKRLLHVGCPLHRGSMWESRHLAPDNK
eukprot:7793573-Ditylum_brightwellii.AAC.1